MPRMAVSRLIGQYTLNTMLIIMKLNDSVNGGQQFATIGQTAARNTNNQTEYGWLDATPEMELIFIV
jgi:hypothetical protein